MSSTPVTSAARRIGSAFLGLSLLWTTSALAAGCPPMVTGANANGGAMRMTVARAGRDQVLRIEGRIEAGLAEQAKDILARHPRVSAVWFNASGSDVNAAMAAAASLRAAGGLVARIPSGWTCTDACTLMFLGGRARVVDPGGSMEITGLANGVTGRSGGGERSAAQDAAGARRLVDATDFLIRMGVSRRLLTEIVFPDRRDAGLVGDGMQRRCLTRAELVEYNVANIKFR